MGCWSSFWIGFAAGLSSVPLVLALCLIVGAFIIRRVP